MIRRHLQTLVLLALLLTSVAVTAPSKVRAAQTTGNPSVLQIKALDTQTVGSRVTLNVELVNLDDKPLPNKPLVVNIDGQRVRRARTDELGLAAINIGNELPVGQHLVEVQFIGSEAYAPSSQTMEIEVRPIQLTIESVPPLAGMHYQVGQEIIVAGSDGIAMAKFDQPGIYRVEALPETYNEANSDTLVEFRRWGDEVFTPDRELEISGDESVQAGFTLSHQVRQVFTDLQGQPVDPLRIESLTLKSSFGAEYTFEDGKPRWLQANRIARRKTGLEATEVQYGVVNVQIHGSNVVNRYQQRFTVKPNDTWPIRLLIYSASVRAKDAIFRFPLGGSLRVEYPNGEVELYDFGPNRQVDLESLARGTYKLQVVGVRGIAPSTPMALSRDQEVVLKVLSSFDIGMGAVLGLLFVFGLLLYGRPHILHTPARAVTATLHKIALNRTSPSDAPKV